MKRGMRSVQIESNDLPSWRAKRDGPTSSARPNSLTRVPYMEEVCIVAKFALKLQIQPACDGRSRHIQSNAV